MKQAPHNVETVLPPDSCSTLEKVQALFKEKTGLLDEYAVATKAVTEVLENDDYTKVNASLDKRQRVINQVNLLDKRIEEVVFVLKMECYGNDRKTVEESLKRMEALVSSLIMDEQKCLARVRDKYENAKAQILEMQSKRKVVRGYSAPAGSFVSRFVDTQN